MGLTEEGWRDGYTTAENAAKWNSHITESKDPFRLNPGGLYDQIRFWAKRHGLSGSGAEVLDVCCGQGVTSSVIAEATGGKVTGVDLSAPLIETARTNYLGNPQLEFAEGDASDLSAFSDGQFEASMMINGLFHLPPGAMVRAMGELSRVTRGPILVTNVNPAAYGAFAGAFHNPRSFEVETEGLDRTTVVYGNPEIAGPGDQRIILTDTPFVMHTQRNMAAAFGKAGLRYFSFHSFGSLSAVGGPKEIDLFMAMELVHIEQSYRIVDD